MFKFSNRGISTMIGLIIIIAVAVLATGGIFAYQYFAKTNNQIQVKTQEQNKNQELQSHQKITLTSDKAEYERKENASVEFTLLNNSSSNIYFPSINQYVIIAEVRWNSALEKYNDEEKKWTRMQNPFVSPKSDVGFLYNLEDPGLKISSLRPGETTKLGRLIISELIEPLDPNEGKYRLVFSYYENELCGGITYWANKEPCEKERRDIFSNEFIIKEGPMVSPKMGDKEAFNPAINFCLGKNDRYYVEKALFLNFDNDGDKEILGFCWGELGKNGLLFVLDKQDNQYKSILEKEGTSGQRHYNFQDLKINDIDGDGIDEIMYGEESWYMAGGDSYLYLYSPKYKEWLYRDSWWDSTSGTKKEGVKFSSNLDLEKYKAFKDFLLKQ